jgi:hypothetical protein
MASYEGHLEVVKYLHEAGGKELLMLTDYVSAPVVCATVCVCVCVCVYVCVCVCVWMRGVFA